MANVTKELNDLLKMLSTAPDNQIDKRFKPVFISLVDKENGVVRDKLKEILDECAYGSLASDFSMKVMDVAWKDLCNLTDVDWKSI